MEGMRTHFFYFTLLKYRDNKLVLSREDKNPFNDSKLNKEYLSKINKHADLTGGFIKKSELKEIAKKISVPYNTLHKWIPKMVSKGLLIVCHTGWKMISMKKAALIVGINIEKLVVRGKTKDELKCNQATSVIKAIQGRQGIVRHKIMMGKVPDAISCGRLAGALGMKSKMSGWIVERMMEDSGRLIVTRDFKLERKNTGCEEKEFEWKRPCNVLTLVKKVA